MRYHIIKPVDDDWGLLGKILRELQYDTRRILNKTIQLCWEWEGFSSDYKKDTGIYPKVSDCASYNTIDGYCYNILKDQYNKLNTANLSASIKKAVQRWKADKKDVYLGNKSIASYRADGPIDIHNKSITIIKDDSNYMVTLSLMSNSFKNELGRKSGRIKMLINEGDKSSRDILERCIDGIYKVSASQILRKNNKWSLNLAYMFKTTHKQCDKDRILGIDMGVVFPVYMAIYNSPVRSKIDGGEIEQFRKQVESRKRKLLQQGKYCGQGRIGHGIKTRIRPIDFAEEKISNFRNTVNHKYSRFIVDFAIRNDCGTIQMEDLKGINKDDVFLKNWTYHDLQEKIRYKAEELGISVKLVAPQYTSQRCSKCGMIDKENRTSQERFICKSCGFQCNADYNAALNIAHPNIDKLINEMISANPK
jgi:transposase, IS605 OrfB family, central region